MHSEAPYSLISGAPNAVSIAACAAAGRRSPPDHSVSGSIRRRPAARSSASSASIDG